jgi:tetratricopeptide (TPR) repeat protein
MARIVLTAGLMVLLSVFVGCSESDKGKGQLVLDSEKKFGYTGEVRVSQKEEVDAVEQMAVNRRAYQEGLKSLIEHYNKVGDNMKLQWAQKELDALNAIPQYKYIIEAEIAGPELKATASIPAADELYGDAVRLEKQGERLVVVKDSELLRLALDKYNELIRKYPTSDKIDDAAYKAAGIYEYFKDYSIAIVYYERTYQWNPETSYPAMFKEAYILDQQLHRRAEALVLYQQAIKSMNKQEGYEWWEQWAEIRIQELSQSEQGSKLD